MTQSEIKHHWFEKYKLQSEAEADYNHLTVFAFSIKILKVI